MSNATLPRVGADAHPLDPSKAEPPSLPHTGFSRLLDSALIRFNDALAWLWLLLIAVIVFNVLMKNFFGQGRVEFEEIQWHIYALLFMFGLSSMMAMDGHVRIDLFYEKFSLKTRAYVDLFGILLLFLPFVGIVTGFALPFIEDSFQTGERSTAPAGLPYRWAIKSVLLIAMVMLILAALSRLSRIVAYLFLGKPAVTDSK